MHLTFGGLGLAAARNYLLSARAYLQLIAVSYAVLAILGLIPATQTTFGLIPIWGHDVWFHTVLALAAAYVGFFAAAAPMRRVGVS